MESGELIQRFVHHTPSTDRTTRHLLAVRRECINIAIAWNERLPDGREKSLAITKLEEAMMWANAAIARNQEDTPSG